jgi:hypothetical protein
MDFGQRPLHLERGELLLKQLSRDQSIDGRIILKKGKEVPLQTWTGPEGSRRSRLPDF